MNLRPVVRATAPIALAASLALVLAACGGSSKSPNTAKPSSSPSATPSAASNGTTCATVKSGATTAGVSVKGAFGKTPSVKVAGAVTATGVEQATLVTGKGAMPTPNDQINAQVSVYSAVGKEIASQAIPQTVLGNLLPVIRNALGCAPYGSRTVLTARVSDIYGAQAPNPLKLTDTIIIVSDLESKYNRPAPAAWTTQVPTVTFDAKGVPTVKLNGAPLKHWAMKILKQGTGAAVVQASASVTLNYQGTVWETHKMFQQTFGSQPYNAPSGGGFIPGFSGAIIGQKVGTELIVTIPPAMGYGAKKSATDPLAGQTLVFVVQITAVGS